MTTTPTSAWTIRPAVVDDAEALPPLENSAGTLFRGIPSLAWLVDGDDLPVAFYRDLLLQGASFMAVADDGAPVAFVANTVEARTMHVWELAVRRDFQRRGIGRALMQASIRDARSRGVDAVTLTTFRDVPWNAPFYATLGFVQIAEEAIDERLARIMRADIERGLPAETRCAMRLVLAGTG